MKTLLRIMLCGLVLAAPSIGVAAPKLPTPVKITLNALAGPKVFYKGFFKGNAFSGNIPRALELTGENRGAAFFRDASGRAFAAVGNRLFAQ